MFCTEPPIPWLEVISLTLLALLFPLAVYCFPLAVYCLILAYLNRRRHPVLVRGTWDLVGLLFAASGFLLFGGPDILQTVYEHQRSAYALKQPGFLSQSGDEAWLFWIAMWVLYFGLVVGGAAFLLRRRRTMTTVYNVHPAIFDDVMTQVLDRQVGSWSRSGNRIVVVDGGVASSDSAAHPEGPPTLPWDPDPAAGLAPSQHVLFELDPFPAMRHVTIYWRTATEETRRAIEAGLAVQLAQVRSGYNPTGGWFLSLAACLFCGTFVSLVLLMATVILRLAR
jgi:hypothetical protein